MSQLYAVILAAGQGTRMKSDRPKVLHELGGRPMIARVLATVRELAPAETLVVVGHGGGEVQRLLGDGARYATQTEQLGTGHALAVAMAEIAAAEGDLLVTYGDMPLLSAATLRLLVETHRSSGADATLLTAMLGEESTFGRIIRDDAGRFRRIVEYRDADPSERSIPEVNAGVYCFRLAPLRKALPRLGRANAQGEYYLTDLFPLLMADGGRIEAVPGGDPDEFIGPNSRQDLAAAEARLRQAVNRHWLAMGVTMIDPDATYIEDTVQIGRDTVILPGSILAGRTRIGTRCRIGPHAEIRDSVLGDGAEVAQAVVIESTLEPGSKVGPYVFLCRGERR